MRPAAGEHSWDLELPDTDPASFFEEFDRNRYSWFVAADTRVEGFLHNVEFDIRASSPSAEADRKASVRSTRCTSSAASEDVLAVNLVASSPGHAKGCQTRFAGDRHVLGWVSTFAFAHCIDEAYACRDHWSVVTPSSVHPFVPEHASYLGCPHTGASESASDHHLLQRTAVDHRQAGQD